MGDPAINAGYTERILSENVGQMLEINNVDYDEDNYAATVHYSVEYCYDLDDADISAVAVLMQDGMSGSGKNWMQNNYYSGMGEVELQEEGFGSDWTPYIGKFTEQPGYIDSKTLPFNHVGLGIYNDFYGSASSLSTVWKENETQDYSISFDFPMQDAENGFGVQNPELTAIAVLLLDNKTGYIIAGDKIEAKDYMEVGIDEVISEVAGATVVAQGDSLLINASEGARVEVFTADGRQIGAWTMSADVQSVPCSAKGALLVRIVKGHDTLVKKLIN